MRGGCAVAMNCVRVRDELRRHATSAAPFAAIWAGVPNHDPTGRKVERGRCFLDSKVGTGVTQSSDSEARRFNLSALTSSRYHRQAVVDHHFEKSRGGNRAVNNERKPRCIVTLCLYPSKVAAVSGDSSIASATTSSRPPATRASSTPTGYGLDISHVSSSACVAMQAPAPRASAPPLCHLH